MSRHDLPDAVRTRLDAVVASAQVLLLMNGSPGAPGCGFSAVAVRLLGESGVAFEAVDVRGDAELREGMKVYSDRPSFPQLYVRGSLLGGADEIATLHERGELAAKLST